MNNSSNLVERKGELESMVAELLAQAKKKGASAADAGVSIDAGLATTIRKGDVETIEHTRDQSLGVTVYFGKQKGSASTSDFTPQGIADTVTAACNIARYTGSDECNGLADAELMASDLPDLDLYHPWGASVEECIDIAVRCEASALEVDERINNSEGATVNSHDGLQVYGNSHGFIGGYPSSRHSISCAVVGQDGESMQRDYWYSSQRIAEKLESPEEIGRQAGERTRARLGAQRIDTCQTPVIFQAEMAVGLVRSLLGAIRGSALYRKSSFLLDQLGESIFPEFVQIRENPRLPQGLASAAFDGEGVATSEKHIIKDGVLETYLLGSYSARKLGMQTTGNAGGARNLFVTPGDLDLKGLMREMDTGLLVTEMMGHGLNMVTGDYSRGAAGFWIKNGEIQFPVEEITIAGNLKQMFQQLIAIGNDIEKRSSVRTGSWLIDQMTVAGS